MFNLKTALLTIFSIFFIGSNSVNTQAITKIDFDSDVYGPFSAFQNNPTISLKITSSTNYSSVQELIYVKRASSASYDYVETKSAHSLTSKIPYYSSFVLPTSTYLASVGMDVKVVLKQPGSSFALKTVEYYVKPAAASFTINPKLYKTSFCELSNYYLYFGNSIDTVEKFMFDCEIDYFDEDYYYRIDVSKFYFTYEFFKDFKKGTAKLTFNDSGNCFPYYSSNGTVSVGLSLSISGNKVGFSFQQTMFVHPFLCIMSPYPLAGFVATKYFYLPKNRMSEFTDNTFNIVCSNMGYHNASFSLPIDYLVNRALIGDCSSAAYCVEGEVLQ